MCAHKKGFSVVAHIHPFDPSHRVMAEMLPGKTIAEIIDELVEYRVGRIIVQIDGWRVKNYKRKPKGGQHVVIRVLPTGDDPARAFDKSGAWGVLIGTGLLVAGFFTGGATWAIGGILFGGGLLSGAIGWGIRAVDAMVPGGAPGSTSLPGIRGARNQLKPWGKIPVVFGKHLITPCYAAKPYTSIGGTKGKDMYLHQLLVVSYGPGRVSQIKIGETLLASNAAAQRNGPIVVDGSFSGVDLDVYQNGTASALFPESVMEENPQMEIRTLDASGGAIDPDTLWRTTAKNVDKVSIDVTMPRGLYRYDDEGNKQSHSVTITVKRRVTGSGTPWASAMTVQTWSLTEAETVTLRYNYTETVTAGQYDYAVWRSADDATDFKGTSMVQWSAFRSIRSSIAPVSVDVRSRYVILGLKIKASSELQGIIDQINCIYEPEVNIYSGGVWTGTGFSRNPVAAFLYMLKGPANPRPIPDSAIDYARLAVWWDICATAGWTCDYVLANPTRLRDALQMLAGTGRASFTMRDGGLYSAVVDAPRSELVQIFTARNVRGFAWQKAFEDWPHGFKVNFISADDGYVSNERIVLDDGYKFDIEGDGVLRDWHGVDKTADPNYTVATRFEQIDLPGVTSADLALKHARTLLAIRKLRPEGWTFETDAESIVCEPGDLVRVSHDAIAVGIQPARIKAVTLNGGNDATSITIDETIEIESGKSYGVRIRQADGTSLYSTISNAAGYTGSVLAFTVPLESTDLPAIGDLVVFGINGVETVECIVGGIESLDDLACRLHVVDAASGVHTADSGTIPAFNSMVTLPGGNPVVESVQENETAKTIAEILGGVYGNAIPTAAPADVASMTAKAYQDYIQLTWPEPSGTTISANPVGYILQRSVDSGTTWKDIAGVTNGTARVQGSTYYWDFNRATDGYPEKTENKGWIPLSSYRFRVKAVNAAGVASAGWATDSSVDTTAYKSWMPTAPVASGSTSARTASLSWTDELAAYGRLRFEGQISIDNTNWFQPSAGLDAYGAETNWRQSATANLFNSFSMPQYTQALPLSGQLAGNPVSTTYFFRFRTVLDCPWTGSEGVGATSSGKRASAWSDAVTVLAKANGAYDLVSGAIVNQLKADSAGLVGMWTSDVNNPTTARDISGQGKHGTVVGATPLADGGFSFDGVNDYIKTVNEIAMPDIFHFHEEWEIPNTATKLQIILGIATIGEGRLLLARGANSRTLEVYYWNGSATVIYSVTNFFETDNAKVVADVSIDWTTKVAKVYKNGLLFNTTTLTNAVKPANKIWYFGNQSALSSAQFCGGKLKGKRLYNRDLTDAGVLALYQNPNTGLPGTIIAERIFTQNLAAIQGLFASVAGGGDDELNYWNLSSIPQGARPVGSFRAGNAEVYIYTNPNAAGTVAEPRIMLMSKGATPGDDDYIAITDTGIVMSDTLMAKVGASSATINAIFTQAIEVGDGGYSYYFAGSGATRKAIRVGSNEVSWGTYPTGGLFTPSNLITQPTTDKYATLVGDFRTPVKTGSYSYAESNLGVTAASKSALLVLRNKTWLLAYPTSNGVVYTNTRVNGVWGTPTNAIGISTYYMCLRELPNGNVLLVYSKYTNRKLYCKIYDGTTWGDELLIADTPVYDVSVEVAQNGDATVIYNKVTPNSGLYATLGTASSSYTTWTVEATPVFSDGSIVDLTTQINTDGVICIVFSYNIPGYKIVRILGKYGSGWSAPAAIINSPDYTNLSLVNFLDGQLGLICKNTSHYPCIFKTVGGSWGAVNVLTNVQRWFMDFTFNQATNTIEGVCIDGSGNLYEASISDTAQCRIGAGIIESGVAPDGSRWQVFSDGTCHIEMSVAITGTAPAFGPISSYDNKTVTFPVELSDTTYKVFTTGEGSYGAWMQSEIDSTKTTTSITGIAYNNYNRAATYNATSKLKIFIIGRKV